MTCLTEERIQQWVDHELDEVARRAADVHLDGCGECQRRVKELAALVEAADRLPRSTEPSRDLWPQVEGRLNARGQSGRVVLPWGQLAAAAAVLALGILIGLRMRPETTVQPRQTAQTATPSSDGGAAESDSDYLELANEVQALRRQVERLVANRGDRFDQSTVMAVNETLATLENADREITQAIEQDPDNRRLRAMRTSSVKREAHVLADLMVSLNGASMVGIEPTT